MDRCQLPPRALMATIAVITIFLAAMSVQAGDLWFGESPSGAYPAERQLHAQLAGTESVVLYYRPLLRYYWAGVACDYLCVKEQADFVIQANGIPYHYSLGDFRFLQQLNPDLLRELPPPYPGFIFEATILVEFLDDQGAVLYWYALGNTYDTMLVNGKLTLNEKAYYDLVTQLLPAARVDEVRNKFNRSVGH